MEMTGKIWMLTAALALASACGDDDGAVDLSTRDSGATAVPVADTRPDAGSNGGSASGSIDSGVQSGSIDASIPATPIDSAVPGDSATPTDSAVVTSIEIAGSWHDVLFGGTTVIDATTFGYANLVEFDNEKQVAIIQNKPDDPFGPNQFSKIVWTPIVDQRFFYCTVGYGLDTLEAARAANMPADVTDPRNGGCGDMGFPWSELVPSIEIAGKWLLDGTPVSIDSEALGDLTIESYDNDANSAVTSETIAGSLPKYSKLRWTQPSASSLYTCYVARGFNTGGQAADDTTQADATQLATGCLGKAWTAYNLAP
jgi:hypothetical protein